MPKARGIVGARRLLVLTAIICNLMPTVAKAELGRLGVIKSGDNAGQWTGINSRLQTTGVDYCIIEQDNWQDSSDLAGIKALFVPNIETLSATQVTALQKWLESGGKVVVSGPTGSLSQPQVRTKLRSLLGAYWGFSLSSPATLDPLQVKQNQWLGRRDLAGTIRGGVVIPSGANSTTAAVWVADETRPAVVVTDRSTFFGWRWGVDTASDADLDQAWLEAALSRYGQFASAREAEPEFCNSTTASEGNSDRWLEARPPSSPTNVPTVPTSPNVNRPSAPVLPPRRPSPTNNSGAITPQRIRSMERELVGLIGRFESALLAADAINSNINSPIIQTIERYTNTANKSGVGETGRGGETLISGNSVAQNSNLTTPGHKALAEARKGLQSFLSYAKQGKYDLAQRAWQQARNQLWNNYPTDRKLAGAEIRAIWLDRGTIVKTRSEADLAKIFDRLAAAGINTVFFETVNASYPIYPSKVAPEQNPLVRGWDPLKAAVKLAHERGMELHAWVWIFAAANQRHNAILNQPAEYLGPVLSRHPTWAGTDRQGQPFQRNTYKAFFDPGNPEVRTYLLSLLSEIATNYNVDGVQLDYIRYPFQDPQTDLLYGYGVASRKEFSRMTGTDPVQITPGNTAQWARWNLFRVQQVDNFVAAAAEMLREKKPNLTISAAVFPIERKERLDKIQQNWEVWAEKGHIDLMMAMSYADKTDDLEDITELLFRYTPKSSTLLIPSIRLLGLPEEVAADQMQLLRNSPTTGYGLFAAENLDSSFANILRLTQGGATSKAEPIPHRKPFEAAMYRYQSLQLQWNFLLSRNQLAMDEEAMKEWATQADSLTLALQALAEDSSRSNLLSAKANLAAFRGLFRNWMKQEVGTNPYQVQVWENSLATVEGLLLYGERVGE
ncbi:MAG: family 10 glycosylhydrolase [Spirulinaceae cyanobacterium]